MKKIILKSIVYRVFVGLVAFIFAFIYSQKIDIAIYFASGDIIIRTLIYYLFEVGWHYFQGGIVEQK